ncbi:MAG: hypothetical protein N4A38_05930 [Candidatus Gracilibacteria bacterium]|jgi:hypothetical protein|nr:hypothetical protein [Candidatus Gracilibacteria bacterium]
MCEWIEYILEQEKKALENARTNVLHEGLSRQRKNSFSIAFTAIKKIGDEVHLFYAWLNSWAYKEAQGSAYQIERNKDNLTVIFG